MELITIEEFLDSHLKNNPSEKRTKEDLRVKLKKTIKAKAHGAACISCGKKDIWAAGSVLVESKMCFSCITGETDDSEDYEVY